VPTSATSNRKPSVANCESRAERHGPPGEIDSLLQEIENQQIELSAVGERLHFVAPVGVLSEGLRARLRENKEELLQALRGPSMRSHGDISHAPFLHQYRALYEKLRSGDLGVSYANGPHWATRIHSAIVESVFLDALRELPKRHPILSARVQLFDGQPRFVMDSSITPIYADFSAIPAQDLEQRIQEKVDEIIWSAFDIESGPLFRPFLIRANTSFCVVGFVVHHLIADAVSVSILARAVFIEYWIAIMKIDAVPSTTPALQYTDYLWEMNRWLKSPALRRRLRGWMATLTHARDCCLPTDFSPGPEERGLLRTGTAFLPRSIAEAPVSLASKLGTTPFTVFLASFACTLSHLLNRTDVVILTLHHGREHPALLNMIGSFQNQVPLQLHVDPESTFEDFVRKVHQACLDGYARQVPYGNILFEFLQQNRSYVFPEFNCLDLTSLGAGSGQSTTRLKFAPQPVTEPEQLATARSHTHHVTELVLDETGAKVKFKYLEIAYSALTAQKVLDLFSRFTEVSAGSPGSRIDLLLNQVSSGATVVGRHANE
jgi:hypothetical protein